MLALMRGSRHGNDFPPTHAYKAERFLRRAVRMYRITTSYRWEQIERPRKLIELMHRLVRDANHRFPRQHFTREFFRSSDFLRFRDGVEVQLSDEPNKQEKYKLAESMAQSDDFWVRVSAARELLAQAEKLNPLEGKPNVPRR
jgi:hypothetical protein